MKKSRIVYLNNTGEFLGGAEQSLLDIVLHLDRSRFEPIVLLPDKGALAEVLIDQSVKVVTAEIPEMENRLSFLWNMHKFSKKMKSLNPDLLHGNSMAVLPAVSFAGRICGVPSVCHIRDIPPDWLVASKRYRSFVKYINKLIAISTAVEQKLSSFEEARNKTTLLHNAIDLKAIDSQMTDFGLHERLGINPGMICIGVVGRLHPEKGIEELMEAFATLVTEHNNVMLIVAGSDRQFKNSTDRDYLHELKLRAKQLEIDSKVHFVGFVKDVIPLMADLDIVAVPSWREPFGRVAIEAMALRKPVVASSGGGLPDIIEDGENGILVHPKDTDSFVWALKILVQDEIMRQKLGVAGRHTVEEKFDYEGYIVKLQKIYEDLL